MPDGNNHKLAQRIANDPRVTAAGRIASPVIAALLIAIILGGFSLQGDVRAFMATVTQQIAAIQKSLEASDRRMERLEDRIAGKRL